MHGVQGGLQPVDDIKGLRGVAGHLAGGRDRAGQWVVADHEVPQGVALEVLLGQVVVFPHLELVQQPGSDVQAVESAQGLGLASEPRDRVAARAVQARQGACLTQHQPSSGAGIVRQVDAAAVGEVQGAFDAVGHGLPGAGRALGMDLLGDEAGGFDPLGHPEDGAAAVGDQCAVGTGEGENPLT